ncbi:hypothetical protein Poly41_70210 [Novipirellula artificiosorum]|uniref:Uncharacterized protein n=1 Tax=Novipirellula artificiosorum TaxID=2528016 RepID=A0A5C6CWL9_9BACT|nr:hypothetical protein Poly41_70210 [Novipirellula artificiosorum]
MTSSSNALRFSIAVLMIATTWIAIVLGAASLFGTKGLAPAAALIACIWFGLSYTNYRSLHAFNHRRWTIPDLLTVLAICAILHGLTIAAVNTRGRRTLPVVAPAATNSPNATLTPSQTMQSKSGHPQSGSETTS